MQEILKFLYAFVGFTFISGSKEKHLKHDPFNSFKPNQVLSKFCLFIKLLAPELFF